VCGCDRDPRGGSSRPRRNGNGPDGKVTICHRTGSETNPIVVITISKNALPAHLRHGDGFFFKGKCFFFHKK
jgi:hypothetical protein